MNGSCLKSLLPLTSELSVVWGGYFLLLPALLKEDTFGGGIFYLQAEKYFHSVNIYKWRKSYSAFLKATFLPLCRSYILMQKKKSHFTDICTYTFSACTLQLVTSFHPLWKWIPFILDILKNIGFVLWSFCFLWASIHISWNAPSFLPVLLGLFLHQKNVLHFRLCDFQWWMKKFLLQRVTEQTVPTQGVAFSSCTGRVPLQGVFSKHRVNPKWFCNYNVVILVPSASLHRHIP